MNRSTCDERSPATASVHKCYDETASDMANIVQQFIWNQMKRRKLE